MSSLRRGHAVDFQIAVHHFVQGAFMRFVRIVVSVCLVVCLQKIVSAQTTPHLENGVKSFGSYDGGSFDTINLLNGNINFHLPLFSYPQRGGSIPVAYVFVGSSKSWQVGEWADNHRNYHQKWVLAEPAGVGLTQPGPFELHRSRHLTTDFAGNQTETDDDYLII